MEMEISWDWSLLYQPVSYLLFDVGFGFHVDEQGPRGICRPPGLTGFLESPEHGSSTQQIP